MNKTITTTTTVVSTAEVVDLTNTAIETHINELNTVRQALKELEAKEKKVKETIFELLNGASEGRVNGITRVAVQEVTRTDINRKMLQQEFSEVWASVSYANPYKKLVTK
jgi:predicted phage-related endonuclease